MIQPESPELAGGFFTSEPPRKPDGEYKSLQFFFLAVWNILCIVKSERDKHCMISLICGEYKTIQMNAYEKQKHVYRYRKQVCGNQRGGWVEGSATD